MHVQFDQMVKIRHHGLAFKTWAIELLLVQKVAVKVLEQVHGVEQKKQVSTH